MTRREIQVVLVDDLAICRREARRILEEAGDIRVTAEACSADAGLDAVRQRRPDVVILDLEMPGRDGLALARAIADEGLPVKMILLTVHRSAALARRARQIGVHGYVPKPDAATDLVPCVRGVMDGDWFASSGAGTVRE